MLTIQRAILASRDAYASRHRKFIVVDRHRGVRLVAFKGVESVNELLEIAAERRKTRVSYGVDRGARVIRYVFDEFCAIEPELTAAIADSREPIVFCGHSMGGAIATFARSHYEMSDQLLNRPETDCVTFGAPIVSDSYSGRDTHVAILGDIVPRIDLFANELRPLAATIKLATPCAFALAPHSSGAYVEAVSRRRRSRTLRAPPPTAAP